MTAAAAHYAAGRLDAAAALLRDREAQDPSDVDARYALAVIDLRQTRWAEARQRLKAVLRRRPNHFGAWRNLGAASQGLNDWATAAAAYDRARAIDTGETETGFRLAVALAVLGRVDEAIGLYRDLAREPAPRAKALARLAILRPSAVTDWELASLGDLATALSGEDSETRVELLFAWAGALEARGADEAAWAAFAEGNRLKHRILTAGPSSSRPSTVSREHALSIARIRRLFTAEFLASNAILGDGATRPIFIVGMPRSGSSLIEQILASHPHVQAMGESEALSAVLEGRFPYPPTSPRSPGHFAALAKAYLSRQAARGLARRARPVDKTLDNHLHVGMIHLMFPNAVILHATRDPLETGVSCFRQLFAVGGETLYDLADIAGEIRRYATMMNHWTSVLPGRVVEVSHEALTADPERRIRWLVVEVCGLTWHEGCLQFHQTRRSLATASVDQARRPISRASRPWRERYEVHLGPLLAGVDSAPADHGRPPQTANA
jgi:tetratricopeptide (TPR) repeat protein